LKPNKMREVLVKRFKFALTSTQTMLRLQRTLLFFWIESGMTPGPRPWREGGSSFSLAIPASLMY
jgi:hypothetical protein